MTTEELVELLRRMESLAIDFQDGHLTIMRFSTGWKITLGTPDMTVEFNPDCSEIVGGGYRDVAALPNFGSLQEALEWASMAYSIRA